MPPSSRKGLYTGRVGQLAVMSELVARGWNAAIPEVDVGDDIFVVKDSTGDFVRVQVKTRIARSLKKKGGYSAQFNIDIKQLNTPFVPELVYVFVCRLEGAWKSFLVIEQEALRALRDEKNIGNTFASRARSDKLPAPPKDKLKLHITYTDDSAHCNKIDLSLYLNGWDQRWPEIEP